ncbi:hypothetical protein G7K_3257-t1 [Saitoella complicata NRRL Y-17804]|uniref:Uncharacterized protein n=1 Tax=Saitoella complicata (strain BCRC 22490 / CBS 7301 / JCM 7358 / NBRC 10748 / NRRL Y-17804) TaxID=698492 RepID=A0A0E9NGY0_SAICN|nr:hypothetical protein G7K_3257-t1 [Saitoella complicata NRRL Y-17804]
MTPRDRGSVAPRDAAIMQVQNLIMDLWEIGRVTCHLDVYTLSDLSTPFSRPICQIDTYNNSTNGATPRQPPHAYLHHHSPRPLRETLGKAILAGVWEGWKGYVWLSGGARDGDGMNECTISRVAFEGVILEASVTLGDAKRTFGF